MKTRRKTHPVFYVLLALILLFLLFRVYAHTQQDNVREAVVRGHLLSSRSSVIFVSIDGQDPSNSFIGRFSKSKVLVRKESQGVQKNDSFGDSWGTYYVDRSTGQKDQLLSIGSISWQGPLRAQVGVGHPGFGERFTVVLTFRGWTVTNKEQTWIE